MDDGTALRLSLIPCETEVRHAMAILRQTLERWGMDQMTAGTVEIVLCLAIAWTAWRWRAD